MQLHHRNTNPERHNWNEVLQVFLKKSSSFTIEITTRSWKGRPRDIEDGGRLHGSHHIRKDAYEIMTVRRYPQNECSRAIEVFSNRRGLSQSVGTWLLGILETHPNRDPSPEVLEGGQVPRG